MAGPGERQNTPTSVRKAVRKQPQVRDFEIEEVDGVKFIKVPSNATASILEHEIPLLAQDIALARTYCIRAKGAPNMNAVHQNFPRLTRYCTDPQIKELMENKQGTSERKESEEIMRSLTAYKASTVNRYSRKQNRRLAKGHPKR